MESGQQLYNRRAGNGGQMQAQRAGRPANLGHIPARGPPNGHVNAGDIPINLLAIELPTIKPRLLPASVGRAQEMGLTGGEPDPSLSGDAKQLEKENEALRGRLERLEKHAGLPEPREGEESVYKREEVGEREREEA